MRNSGGSIATPISSRSSSPTLIPCAVDPTSTRRISSNQSGMAVIGQPLNSAILTHQYILGRLSAGVDSHDCPASGVYTFMSTYELPTLALVKSIPLAEQTADVVTLFNTVLRDKRWHPAATTALVRAMDGDRFGHMFQ